MDLLSIPEYFGKIISDFLEVNSICIEALNKLINSLIELDNTIVLMSNLNSEHYTQFPVLEGIALIKYFIPDDVFFFVYSFILFGVLFVMYKLILVIIKLFKEVIGACQDGFSFSGAGIMAKITSLFR